MRLRAFLRLLAITVLFAACATIHLVIRNFRPSPWPRRFLRGTAWLAGARVRTVGHVPTNGTLILANHVSWLDIPMLAGATDCAFVAKDNLGDHPFMRWLCEENGTVFVARDRRASVSDQVAAMEAAIRSHKPLCLFPEGTVSDGTKLLPFRSSLLKLAEDPPLPLTVQPAAIDYGANAPEFGWPAGETGQANFIRLLGRKGTVDVVLRLLPPLAPAQDRKALTAQSRAAIASALRLA